MGIGKHEVDECEGLDPDYVHTLREFEIATQEAICPPDERKVLTPEAIKELQDWARKRWKVNG